ncbi:glycosyl hydrolase family 28-related protein [Mycolicibacterium baixiangningiae]|uniref:glycosyl hydrolase family 28-related protein n=1 Tax=Mycolicibacterium baixiangningiae TaxID=2761578 RepID=UPI001868FC46|nr:glycosyl hydrolase family 28-related protein [Mycolicibacterium baixiangningiae]
MANARDFGVMPGETDQSIHLQDAIDFTRAHGLTLFLPAGSYVADNLVLRDQTRLVGAGPESTVIRAVPGSGNGALLTIDSGRVRNVLVEGIGFHAADSNERHGIHVQARRADSDDASGLWHSDFRSIRVWGFGGAQLWLQGGGNDSRDPVQFLTFTNVVLERPHDSKRSTSLLMSGQVNQTVWLNGRIDGFGSEGPHPGTNAKICRQLDHYDPSADGFSRYLSDKSGHTHLFAGVSFQQAQLGVYVDGAESITFDTCHFEGLDSGLLFVNAGRNRVARSHFANAAQGDGEAFSIRAASGSEISGSGNVFIGRFGVAAAADDSGATVSLTNTMSSGELTTRNLTTLIDPADEINVGAATTVALKASPTPVRVVTANRFPGETIVFKASGGSVFFDSGGNIDFEATASPIEVTTGGTLTLVRFDSGPDWCIQAVHGAR